MASKLVILAAALAALMVITNATIITTEVEIDDDSPRQMIGTGRCRRELRSKWPDNCQQYMMRGMMRRMEDDSRGRTQYFDQCCDDLMRMQPECQCEAMKMMVKDMEMSLGQRKMPQLMEKAMEIPMMCGTIQHKCPMSHMQ